MRKLLSKFTQFGQKRPTAWLIAWSAWFISLWLLSAGNPAPKELPVIPHLDKIAHFGFFFGGAGLLCAWLRHYFQRVSEPRCLVITTVVGGLVGALDEYHQTFTPGRTGNDFYDWLADVSGSLAGAIVMIALLKVTSAWSVHKKKDSSTISP